MRAIQKHSLYKIIQGLKSSLVSIFLLSTLFAEEPLPIKLEQEYIVFDLYQGDTYKGLIPVYYAETYAELENPEEVLELLDLKKASPEIIELISGKIEKTRSIKSIGSISIDTDTFRVIVILEEKFLKTSYLTQNELIKVTSKQASFRNDIQFWNLESSETDTYNFYRYQSDLALGSSWARYIGNNSTDKNQIDELTEASINNIQGRWQFSGGYLESRAQLLRPNLDFTGISIRTEPLLYENSDTLRGSTLEIYVPVRSRVEFYKQGRLIDTQILPSGKQQVDTTRFPQGSYFVDIIINDGIGVAREQRKYYSKSGYLTTRGAPNFEFDFGKLRREEDIIDIPYFQNNFEWRIADPFQLELGSFGTDKEQTGVIGVTSLIYDFLLFGATSYSTDNNQGYSFGAGGEILGVSLSFDYEKSNQITINELEILDLTGETPDPEDIILNQELEGEGERKYFRISKWYKDFELSYTYNEINFEKQLDYKSQGPALRIRLAEDANDSIYFEISSQKTNQADNNYALLSWQHRFLPWTSSIQAGYKQENSEDLAEQNSSLQYDTLNNRSGRGLRARVGDKLNYSKDEKYANDLSSELNYGNRFGGLGFASGNTNTDNQNSNALALGANTSLVVDSKGNFSSGPAGLGDAILIVELHNDDNQAIIDIMIDGMASKSIKGNQKVQFGLAPYQTYEVRIKPSANSPIIKYDNTIHRVRLYPGHTQTIKFDLEKKYIALGKLIDKDGNPLIYKRIYGLKEMPLTEVDGSFQLEIKGNDELEAKIGQQKCKFKLPKPKTVEYFFDYKEVICK